MLLKALLSLQVLPHFTLQDFRQTLIVVLVVVACMQRLIVFICGREGTQAPTIGDPWVSLREMNELSFSCHCRLFVFEVDSMGELSVDQLIPICGVFEVKLQSSIPSGCQVEVSSSRGTSLVYRLPYDTSTAMLFSLVKNAKEAYGQLMIM